MEREISNRRFSIPNDLNLLAELEDSSLLFLLRIWLDTT